MPERTEGWDGPGREGAADARPLAARPLVRAALACAALAALLALLLAASLDDDEDGRDGAPSGGVLRLAPGETAEDLFAAMVRLEDGLCPAPGGRPLLAPDEASRPEGGCVVLENAGSRAAIWRIDFEDGAGTGYAFELRRAGAPPEDILSGEGRSRTGDPRRFASGPIALAPGERAEIRLTRLAPGDVEDADPVLTPEARFDAAVAGRAMGFGALLGASVLVAAFFAAFARILGSRPAHLFAWYLAAATLAAMAEEGVLPGAAPAGIAPGLAAELFEAALIAFHLAFVGAFVEEALPGHWTARAARRLAVAAPLLLALAGAAAWLGGLGAWLRYRDLGFELDPLVEPGSWEPALLISAGVTLAWFAAMAAAAAALVRGGARGRGLFAAGVAALLAAMLADGAADALPGDLGDDHLGVRYVLLLDALLFAAAIVRRTAALRGERDAALRAELGAVREAAGLSARLLAARGDADEARALADARRARLATTSHDLRQPLQSLRLALEEARASSPALGERLETSLAYLDGVLGTAMEEARPGAEPEDAPGRETVPLALVLDNAVRMFAAEAAAKGLDLRAAPTSLSVRADPVALIRAVANLAANAIRYAEEGGVLVGARPRGGSVSVEVWDTGPGLDAAEIERIRRPYERGEAGTGEGLGLPATEALLQAQGARLAIRSRPGRGSVFAIEGLERAG